MRSLFLLLILFSGRSFAAKVERLSPFELAKQDYEARRYERAIDQIGQESKQAKNNSERNLAYYYQGMILFELGFYYSSFVSFRNVLLAADTSNKEIYEKAIRNAVLIANKLNMVQRIGKILEKLPPSLIPASLNSSVHYATGAYWFHVGENEKAASRLRQVSSDNNNYAKAQFLLGVVATKKKDYKQATNDFQKAIDASRGKRELSEVGELARLNIARSVYSLGNMASAVRLYSQFSSSSPHWLTILFEASWPLLRSNDTAISLGNLHTVLSPFYREELVGEGYILRTTILYSLCKYEEMRRTLTQFFTIYDPILRSMQYESQQLGSSEAFYRSFNSGGLNRAFVHAAKREVGIRTDIRVLDLLREEKRLLGKISKNEQIFRMVKAIQEVEHELAADLGSALQRLHKRKLAELLEQREQANYLKIEIVTGEKEMIEGQKDLPPRRYVDVTTSVKSDYDYWPFHGEYWEDELGAYVYATESSCLKANN